MCFSGFIRGAIAFGLAISIESNHVKNREVMISSTLVLVFFTTIVFGALMPSIVNFFKQGEKKNNQVDSINESNLETYSLQRYDESLSA